MLNTDKGFAIVPILLCLDFYLAQNFNFKCKWPLKKRRSRSNVVSGLSKSMVVITANKTYLPFSHAIPVCLLSLITIRYNVLEIKKHDQSTFYHHLNKLTDLATIKSLNLGIRIKRQIDDRNINLQHLILQRADTVTLYHVFL